MLIIESVINRYLALDPEMLDKMAAFDGKVIKLEITVINKTLFIFPSRSGIDIRTDYQGEVDTLLRGSPLSLLKMGMAADVASLLLKGEIEVSGDTRLGHQFKQLFSQMDIDWSEPLAQLVGDGFTCQLQQTGNRFRQWSKDSAESISLSVSEYLQEESRDVVTETELRLFNDAVDQLRNDVDRLQAKINRAALADGKSISMNSEQDN